MNFLLNHLRGMVLFRDAPVYFTSAIIWFREGLMAVVEFAHIEADCRYCKRKNQHEVVHEEIESIYEYDDEGAPCDLEEREFWQIIRCCGCRKFAFRTYSYADWAEMEDGNSIWGEQIYPVPALNSHEKRSFRRLPREVEQAYQEVVSAFNTGLFMLAGIGVRMVIEGICNNSGISGTLNEKIDALKTRGHLSIVQAELLHELRKHGNEAAHELFIPSAQQMKAYLNALETTLDVIYEHQDLKQMLEAERLRRKAEREGDGSPASN